ncbi:hypothetical protein TSMEX_004833 [Taenia solium]|eukprot:TsM_000424000 transcript=TsM_000424000 gene=TsM_000424000
MVSETCSLTALRPSKSPLKPLKNTEEFMIPAAWVTQGGAPFYELVGQVARRNRKGYHASMDTFNSLGQFFVAEVGELPTILLQIGRIWKFQKCDTVARRLVGSLLSQRLISTLDYPHGEMGSPAGLKGATKGLCMVYMRVRTFCGRVYLNYACMEIFERYKAMRQSVK